MPSNYMPDPNGEWTLKENNSELHHGIYSKVNQFIYTFVWNYMPNIRILAKAVLQIFRSQGCSYTKCLCLENGSNSTENLRNVLKSLSANISTLDIPVSDSDEGYKCQFGYCVQLKCGILTTPLQIKVIQNEI